MLELKNVSSGYSSKNVIKNISLSFEKGEFVSIIGANGCGKTTLLKTITGILKASRGEIFIDGNAVKSQKELAKKIAYLPQNKAVPQMTVGELVLHGRFPRLDSRSYNESDKEIALWAMREMGIEKYKDTPLEFLSGGMKQTAYIAMALCQKSDWILLDEPAAHLDISHQLTLMKFLSKSDKGVIAVMHDLPLAFTFSNRIVLMNDGEILLNDTPEKVSSSPLIKEMLGVKLKYSYEI